ncbi:hypothetical protein [Pseudomonas sp. IT-196MI5]|uniref:hypothetical protein n=1 Tax=Pseudomonas sp. IT-196MI5 TaxID=3026440 RepID=UPI0039E0E394
MTPEVAVGMGGSIGACIREKNRWSGKAMFTVNQESSAARGIDGVCTGLIASRLAPTGEYIPNVGASLLAKAITRSKALPSP